MSFLNMSIAKQVGMNRTTAAAVGTAAVTAFVAWTTANKVAATHDPVTYTKEWRHATEAAEVHGVKREGSRHPVPENPMRHHMSAKEYKAVTSL